MKCASRSQVIFTGYYGQRNTGDDAFVEVAAWGAEKYWRIKHYRFLARSGNLPIINRPAPGYPYSVPKTYRFQQARLIRKADYLVSAGGSTLHSQISRNRIKSIALKHRNRLSSLRLGAVGVSIGPFNSIADERDVIEYLKKLEFLTVRDRFSFDYASSLNLPYKPVNAFDLAALLPSIYGEAEKSCNLGGRAVVGVSICPYESLKEHLSDSEEWQRVRRIARLIIELDEIMDVYFKFFLFNGHPTKGDAVTVKQALSIARPQRYSVIPYQKQTQKMWDEVTRCDFLLGTRLHSAIFACFSGVPFMLNEYHQKCTDFLNTVGYSLDYRWPEKGVSGVKQQAEQIARVIHDQAEYIKPPLVQQMVDKSLRNFTEVEL